MSELLLHHGSNGGCARGCGVGAVIIASVMSKARLRDGIQEFNPKPVSEPIAMMSDTGGTVYSDGAEQSDFLLPDLLHQKISNSFSENEYAMPCNVGRACHYACCLNVVYGQDDVCPCSRRNHGRNASVRYTSVAAMQARNSISKQMLVSIFRKIVSLC